jgi:CRISPR/Cas system-associated protein Cas7 (RAMP superfamily)
MFVSFGFRFRVEVEALNMAETVGNYARHARRGKRKAVRKGGFR